MDQVDCNIDVAGGDDLAQAQFAVSGGESDHCLEGTHGHWAGDLALV